MLENLLIWSIVKCKKYSDMWGRENGFYLPPKKFGCFKIFSLQTTVDVQKSYLSSLFLSLFCSSSFLLYKEILG